MKIRDYIHLYYGHECDIIVNTPRGENIDRCLVGVTALFTSRYPDRYTIKLKLRPLSDMTIEEDKEIQYIRLSERGGPNLSLRRNAAETAYLLSRGFDLFGLIKQGLAIDKTKQLF